MTLPVRWRGLAAWTTPVVRSLGIARDVRCRRAAPSGVQGVDPEMLPVGHHQYASPLGQRRYHLAGEAEHGRLVGRAVPNDQRPVPLSQLLQHPPERGPQADRVVGDQLRVGGA